MAWIEPQYSRRQVDKAGQFLIAEPNPSSQVWRKERTKALTIVSNWRAAHAYPLHATKMTLRTRAKRIDKDALVAQRLKRLESIIPKLERFPHISLSRMQDLGGCRAILDSMGQATELSKAYVGGIKKFRLARSELVKINDYISEPKLDGYRFFHMIYRYRTSSPKFQMYNGMRTEIQVRTRLQHAWATAVETVSTFTNQALKSDRGKEDWKRFFALMSTFMARQEGTALVPCTPQTETEVRDELNSLCKKFNLVNTMQGWRDSMQFVHPALGELSLLVLDVDKRELIQTPFDKKKLVEATERYLEIEQETQGDPMIQVVLVSTDSIQALKAAYPSYYLDTTEFIESIVKATSG